MEDLINEKKVIFNRKRTQIEMMRDRGYHIDKKELNLITGRISIEEYLNDPNNSLSTIYKPARGNEGRLPVTYVLFQPDSESAELINEIRKVGDSKKASHFIIVSNKPPNETAVSEISNKYPIELFEYDMLAINPTRHALSPKYRLLSTVEKENFYASTRFAGSELPGISIHDPITKYYGANVKDVLHIVRNPILPSYLPEHHYWREVREISTVFKGASSADVEDDDEDDDYVDENANEIGHEAETDEQISQALTST